MAQRIFEGLVGGVPRFAISKVGYDAETESNPANLVLSSDNSTFQFAYYQSLSVSANGQTWTLPVNCTGARIFLLEWLWLTTVGISDTRKRNIPPIFSVSGTTLSMNFKLPFDWHNGSSWVTETTLPFSSFTATALIAIARD